MDKLRSGPLRATAAAALVIAVLAAAMIVRPFGPGSSASPTLAPSVTSPASPATPSAPSPSPTAAPQTDRQRAQAIADRLIEQAGRTGGRATAAGYVKVKLLTYGRIVNTPNPTLSPAAESGDDLLVVEVDGWFPAPRGLESPNPAATSGTATNIAVAWDLRLQRQIDVRFGFDPESSEVPGASPVLGHHMTSLTTFGTTMFPLTILPPDVSPERAQVDHILTDILATSKGASAAAGYLVTTLGRYRTSGMLRCRVMTPASEAKPCPLSDAAASAWPSTSSEADELLVVEIDGDLWSGGNYSGPQPGSIEPVRPAGRFEGRLDLAGPLTKGTTLSGLIVVYDMTAGVMIGETLLVGRGPGLWAISQAGTPTVLWDWTPWRPSPS